MTDRRYVVLAGRSVLALSGEDARGFLQGMISNDMRKVSPARTIYAGFLTPQGKFLADLFVAESEDRFLLDCEANRLAELVRRLALYKVRARVAFDDRSGDYLCAALIGPKSSEALGLAAEGGASRALDGGVAYTDPRLVDLGARAMVPRASALHAFAALGFAAGAAEDYERLRLELGVPDGSRDMAIEKAILLENGFEELNGVDFEKGCFIGQELTARTKHRGLIKKRLFKVAVEGPVPQPGTPILLGEHEAGEMRSGLGALGLALLRLEDVRRSEQQGTPLRAASAVLRPIAPKWARIGDLGEERVD